MADATVVDDVNNVHVAAMFIFVVSNVLAVDLFLLFCCCFLHKLTRR